MITIIGYHHNTGRRVAYAASIIQWGYEFYIVPYSDLGDTSVDHEGVPLEWRTVENV